MEQTMERFVIEFDYLAAARRRSAATSSAQIRRERDLRTMTDGEWATAYSPNGAAIAWALIVSPLTLAALGLVIAVAAGLL